ncbi:MAG: DUF4373 domain-containing protein [Lachnospiraceae bacterium]|jgi:hypothetical protein|nr:DUF4373 domain-containing protein [Lachnospiraceae bacterium]
MARHKQDGLIYFPFDTDFFYADKRIKRLHAKFGNDGLIFYIYLLTEIYRNGYYISWDEDAADDIATDLRLKEGFIEQVLTYLRGRLLLTESTLSTGVTIITSPGIQKRYQEAVKSRKRAVYVDSEIWLLNEEETASHIKVTVNYNKSCGNDNKSCGNDNKSCGNDTKESKVKESKVKQRESLQCIEEFISAYPKDCNRYLTEREYASLLITGKVTEDELVSCAKNYAKSCRILGTQKRYIKNAENFLKEFVFEKYLPGKYKKPAPQKNGFNNFEQRDVDYDALVAANIKRQMSQGLG